MSSGRVHLKILAGPAELTAAYELLDKTEITSIIFEMTGEIGGISKAVVYKNNRIDIGGHRFFSKLNRVMEWRLNLLPLQGEPASDDKVLGRTVPLARSCKLRPLRSNEIRYMSCSYLMWCTYE